MPTWTCPACALVIPITATTCPQDGTPHDVQEQLDDLFSTNYEFLGTIGTGGMSVIYKARQLMLDKTVAIKMLHSHLLNENSIMRFQREAKAASSMKHPNVIAVHDFGISKLGQPYMVMDFIDGKTLAELLSERGALPLPEAMDIFLAVCGALEHAHQNNLLHRDLKPSNIMLRETEDGYDVFLVDFGIAKVIDAESGGIAQQLTQTGEVMGSPLYMSPEQCMGKKVDQRSDIYSLGCILYEAVVGVPPHRGETMLETIFKHLNEAAVALHDVRTDITFPDAFEDLVMRLLATHPDDRIQTISEVRQSLLAIQAGALRRSGLAKAGVPLKLNISKPNAIFATGALLATAGLVALVFAINDLNVAQRLKAAADKQIISAADGKESKEQPASEPTKSVDEIIGDPSVHNLAQLSTSTGSVNLENSRVSDSALYALGRLPRLKSLNLNYTDVSDRAIKPILKLKSLTTLALKRTNVTTAGIAQLVALTDLRDLDLDGTATSDDALQALSKMPNLTSLKLRNTKISDKGLEYLQNSKNLKSLSLSGSDITNKGLTYIAKLPLTNLNLWDTKVSAGGIENLKDCKKLEYLCISRAPLSERDLKAIENLNNLVEVQLYNMHSFKDADLKYFTHHKFLRKFYVQNCPITDAAAPYLDQMPQLTGLTLNATKITGRLFARTTKLENLAYLWIQMNPLTDSDMKYLTGLKNLHDLYIDSSLVSDAGLRELDDLPHLNRLSANYCKNISTRGIAAFYRTHPFGNFETDYTN
ncbi:MAG: protein kinase [Cyanobacteria bacterium SZAS-4]|nr:protein kinase [Cyanobacteria bacterium SZAS-4]